MVVRVELPVVTLLLTAIGIAAARPAAAAQADAAPLADFGAAVTVTAADCTTDRLGATIAAEAIGEPVSAVTLAPPTWVETSTTAPAHCRVDGRMAPVDRTSGATPDIHFRVLLPASWSHRAIQLGGGGLNGTIPDLVRNDRFPIGDAQPLALGFATYGSDSGHQTASRGGQAAEGPPPSPLTWTYSNEAIRNLGYMQLKKTHDAAMVLIERLYGEAPQVNYFAGSSQGGREALTVVQRYPEDYDGVVANAPIVSFSSLMLGPELIRIQERALANWVTPAKTEAVRAEFLRQCDGLDGLVDGVINHYMACRAIFDVSQGAPGRDPWADRRCPGSVDPDPADTGAGACLTDGQIETLEFVYRPYRFATPLAHEVTTFGMWVPTTAPSGSGLILGERVRGQEGAAPDAPMHRHTGTLGVTGFLMGNVDANPLDYVEGGAFDERRVELSPWLDSTDPDLSAFAARGGKLIVTIGTNDTRASSGAQLAYYQAILERMGPEAVDAFARLFVIPQAGHGLSGEQAATDGAGHPTPGAPIPSEFDRLGILVDWVENDRVPGRSLTVTADGRSGPLCAFPAYPRYEGGPVDEAASYSCATDD